MWLNFVVVLVCLEYYVVNSSQLCIGIEEATPRHRLATKTGYFAAEKDATHWAQFKDEVNGCTASQMWLLNRHGTRYPTENDMGRLMDLLPGISQRIIANHQHGRGCMKEKELDELQDWFPPYSLRDNEQLHETGYEELETIGQYWKNLFPGLFNINFDPVKFKVDFTVKNRTGQSAYHFLSGMFGEDQVGNIEMPQPYSPNFILRFYKACPRWLREVYKNNETTYKERRMFIETEHFNNMTHWVSKRLGFMHPLTPDEVESVYDECRYETAWWPERNSVWCHPFTTNDFEVMEYYTDLKYYYEDAYGHPLNLKTACRTLSDIYLHFKSTVNSGEPKPQGIFYFAHDKTIMKVQASLGMFRPRDHLRHDNFLNQRHRIWRTSFVSPFSANLAFVLYRCGREDMEGDIQYKVGGFFQGQPTPLTQFCHGVACQWDELRDFFAETHSTCDLSKLCMLRDEL